MKNKNQNQSNQIVVNEDEKTRPTVSKSETQLFSTVIWQCRRLHSAEGMGSSKFLDLPTWFVPFFSEKDRFDAFNAAFEIASNRQFEFDGILK